MFHLVTHLRPQIPLLLPERKPKGVEKGDFKGEKNPKIGEERGKRAAGARRTREELRVEHVDGFAVPGVLVLQVDGVQHVLDEDGEHHGHEDGVLRGTERAGGAQDSFWGGSGPVLGGFWGAGPHLEAENQLDGGSPREDAVVRVADEEEIQDPQQEHQGCGGYRG